MIKFMTLVVKIVEKIKGRALLKIPNEACTYYRRKKDSVQ